MAQMYEIAQAVAAQGSAAGEPLHPELADASLMIVDDEPMMSEVTQTYLEDGGWRHFITVNDPRQVLATAQAERPGLILLDLIMPGMNGFEVLERLRADASLRYTPVIVLTAASDPASKLRALELGATEFLSKPVDESELKIRVRNSLIFKVYQDRLANDDPLTGLPNRRVFVEKLAEALGRAQRAQQRMGLLHLNLDRFRQINDTLGHAAGDELLRQVGERLRAALRSAPPGLGQRQGDAPVLARLGGDEFGLLLPFVATPEPADRMARHLLAVMGGPFVVQGRDLFVTPSIGITVYPDDGQDDATLLANAGVAMRHAKDSGRNGHQFYAADLNHLSLERLQLESELRLALEHEELVLHYQPKVDLHSGRVIGAEALIRWMHPSRGMVPPGQFIPIAEETGLIVDIGEWVVRRACRQMAQWRDVHGIVCKVAVNVARHGLVSGGLTQVVRGALTEHQVSPRQLILELTESMLMDRVETTAARLHELRGLGVELSIDDFGTGYSSMSYLKQFPVQELKIDRSFVKGTPDDATDVAIVRALVVLGHSLNMRVVAEGVEQEPQRATLAELGCDCFQGFLCSKPLPADEFAAKWLQINGAPSFDTNPPLGLPPSLGEIPADFSMMDTQPLPLR